ncbi:MAG: copper resistance protein CopC [Pseudomonadales bacterium]|nr:copper resistance protein CopC [Pseudomonadales bacterium]
MKLSALASRVLMLFLLLPVAMSVQAHSALKSSTPVANATVAAADTLSLGFNGAVRLVRLVVTDANEQVVPVQFAPVASAQEEFSIPLPALMAGVHKVDWSIIGADGHTVSESFSFTIDPAAAPHQHQGDHAGHADHANHDMHQPQTQPAAQHAH